MWTLLGVLVVAILWGATQLAMQFGQDVDWYAGFGQWLGALASVFAAGIALWIATSDRRDRMNEQRRELTLEASLVRVQIGRGWMPNPVNYPDSRECITVTNWRRSELFDIEVRQLRTAGDQDIGTDKFSQVVVYSAEKPEILLREARQLRWVPIDPKAYFVLFPAAREELSYAAIRYTDSAGRRWQVDSNNAVIRLDADPA